MESVAYLLSRMFGHQVSDSQCDVRQEASLSELQMCVYQEDEAADMALTDSKGRRIMCTQSDGLQCHRGQIVV